MKKTVRTAFVLMWLLMAFTTGYSQQPLVYKTINEAAEKGDLADVKRHLERGANVNAKDKEFDTPLAAAAIEGHLEVVKLMVANGADVNARNQDGKTPLIWAALEGQLEVAKFLLEKGADVNAKDNDGDTPLGTAVLMGELEVAKMLVDKGASMNAKDKSGNTPLGMAVLMGESEVAKFLVAKGADVNAKDNNGTTPLLWAAGEGHYDAVKFLVEKGADVNARDNNGRPPLLWAADTGSCDIVKFIVEKGADVNARDNNGNTPLLWAANKGHLEVVKFLVENGAHMNDKNNNGNIPLDIARSQGHQDIINYLVANAIRGQSFEEYCASVEQAFLINAGFDKRMPPSAPDPLVVGQPTLMEQKDMMSGTHEEPLKKRDELYKNQLKTRDRENQLYQLKLSIYLEDRQKVLNAARQYATTAWKAAHEVTPAVNNQNKQEIQTAPIREPARQKVSIQIQREPARPQVSIPPQQERPITPASSVAAIGTGASLNYAKTGYTILIIGIIISVFIILVGVFAAIENREQDKGKKIRFAVAGLILSIFGSSILICWVLGIIFGHIALAKIKNDPVQYGGKIIAITGLWLGYFTLCFGIVTAVLKVMAGLQLDEIVQELIRTGRLH